MLSINSLGRKSPPEDFMVLEISALSEWSEWTYAINASYCEIFQGIIHVWVGNEKLLNVTFKPIDLLCIKLV